MTADGLPQPDSRVPGGGLPRVDPLGRVDLATRLVRRAFVVPLVGSFMIRAAPDVDPLLHRWTRGRFGLRAPMPFASLTTTGARSGRPRTTTVLYFHDGDDVILVASNYGRTRHPAWYHNLKANPEALLERGGRSGSYVASEVNDEQDRERMFTLVNLIYPGFAAIECRLRPSGTGSRSCGCTQLPELRPAELSLSFAARPRRSRRARR